MNFKKNKQSNVMGNKIKKNLNALVTLSIAMMVLVLTSPLAEAAEKKGATSGTPSLFSDTKTLLGDAGGWITAIAGAVAGFIMIGLGLKYAMTDDPGSRNEIKKQMKNVFIGLAICLSAVSLIAIIVTYYT
ncbi:pilin [Exiguobacterium acetylicum]|uniref:pilin n=1 Tax=Exiguobacterium acetylicum TaxID=41170 RepID=UPI001CA7088B|nr:pilin [Exiguobacterium acetylicum]QZY88618.1 pilin [Exiguobacterium acetylicum]